MRFMSKDGKPGKLSPAVAMKDSEQLKLVHFKKPEDIMTDMWMTP